MARARSTSPSFFSSSAYLRQISLMYLSGSVSIARCVGGVSNEEESRAEARAETHLEYLAGAGDAEELGGASNVDLVHGEAVLLGHGLHRALVDGHGVARQAVLLLQVGVHHEEHLGLLGRHLLQRLLEQVPR